jgi:FkbM family methyltransferase
MSLLGKIQWALRHPASTASPVTVLTRLAVWRVRTALHLGTTVSVTERTMEFWCPPEWRGNAKMMYVWRDDYESEIRQLHRWVQPGDLVLDVGAHYGSYTLCLAGLVGAQGHVLAVEPAAHARSVLRRNTLINQLHQVQIVPAAAGAESARANLHLHDDRSRASLQPGGQQSDAESVEVIRLDDLVPRAPRVSLIKMDIEGYEAQALRGATEILTRDQPIVIFELLDIGSSGATHTAWDLLRRHGYRMHRVTDEGEVRPVESPEQHSGASCNVIAIHPGRQNDIGTDTAGGQGIAPTLTRAPAAAGESGRAPGA